MSSRPGSPQIRTSHRVALVVFDGVTMLDVSGPGEVLHQARLAGHPYTVKLVSPRGGTVTASSGVGLGGTVVADDAGPVDTLLVPGSPSLAAPGPDEEVLGVVRALSARATRVASVCTGAFLLAELGLLDGLRATTHWRHADTFARRYPRVRLEPDVIHVRDGRCITSAGITAGMDMALALLEEDHGADAARDVARELVMFMQRPGGQSQFSTALSAVPPHSSPLRVVTDAVLARPEDDHSVTALARAAAVSPRHLTRLFQTELRTTPARWVERVRLDRARQLLLDGHSVTVAARHSGFGQDETLRRVFARHLGTTPTEYRRRFATTRPTPGPGHTPTALST